MITSPDMAFAFLQGAPLPIIAADAAGNIAFVNDQAVELFRYSEAEMIGAPLELLIPAAVHAQHRDYYRNYLREPRARVMGVGRELRGVDRDGREFPVEIGLTPIVTAQGTFVVAAVADISVRKQLEREVTAAKLVQEAMLPRRFPTTNGCEVGGATRFAEAAGGDFFDGYDSGPHEIMLVIGDASGHGFAAALISVAAKSYLRALSAQSPDLPDLLRSVNRLLIEELAEGRFVTLFVGKLDTATWKFHYAGAGHAGYIVSQSGVMKSQLVSTGPPLGWFAEAAYDTAEIDIAPGDRILLMTDGIEESFDANGQPFGRERIFQSLAANVARSSSEQAQEILEEVRRFTGGRQHDDMTILMARRS